MNAFCPKCGSLMRVDLSKKGALRTCPHCLGTETGLPERGAHAGGNGNVPATLKAPYSVRKGVSPRTSTYARRSLAASQGADAGSMEDALTTADLPGRKSAPMTGASGGGQAKSEAGRFFPFDTIRPGQKEFMEDAHEAAEKGLCLLANVPTGLGKTAASLSAFLDVSLSEGKMVIFLTSKQSQHSIAVDTLRRLRRRSGRAIKVVDMTSKQSMCPRDISRLPHSSFNLVCRMQAKDRSCSYGKAPPEALIRSILSGMPDVDALIDESSKRRVCPHRAALEAAREADVLVCDYNHIFSDLSNKVLSGLNKDLSELLLVIDEGHNLPDRIRAQRSKDLNIHLLQDAMELRGVPKATVLPLATIRDLMLSKAGKDVKGPWELELDKRAFVQELKDIVSERNGGGLDPELLPDLLKEVSARRGLPEDEDPLILISEHLDGLFRLKASHLLYLHVPEGRSAESLRLSYKDLDPSDISGPVLRSCRASLIMSGTLMPPSMFGDVLGAPKNRRVEKVYRSPFPKENRLVLLERSVTTAFSSRNEEMFRHTGERVVSMVGRFPGNVAAFFPSYNLLSEVRRNLWGCPKKVLIEERQMGRLEKEGIVEELKRSKEKGGALLLAVMGGSLSEGVDYRDNLLTGVIVVGLPLAPPSLETRAIRSLFRGKFGPVKGDEYSYIYPAVNKVLQAAGRSTRSEDDRSVVILMERRLSEERYLKFLPPEACPTAVAGRTLEGAIDDFFG